MKTYHVLTPLIRYDLIDGLVDNLSRQRVIWHPLTQEEGVKIPNLRWIKPLYIPIPPEWKGFEAYYKFNRFGEIVGWIDQQMYVYLGDDDLYAPGAVDILRETPGELVMMTMRRGDRCPGPGKHGCSTLTADPGNRRMGSIGFEQLVMSGRLRKQWPYRHGNVCEDGFLAERLAASSEPWSYAPRAEVLFNVFEPGRWDGRTPAAPVPTPAPPVSAQAAPIPAPRMAGKICITTTFDRNYAAGGRTLFKSIRRHTDCAGIDFKVITADPEVVKEFGAENCHFVTDEIKARYADVKYIKELPPERYAHSWYRYEMFNFTGYDRVICIDSDCICPRDISHLFSADLNQYDLVSVEDHFVTKVLPGLYPQLEANGWNFDGLHKRIADGKIDIQPAMLVANKRVVNEVFYRKLIHYANTTPFTYSIDEGILNDFIYREQLRIHLLPLEWNYQDLYAIRCPQLPSVEPIIVHCQESKPFKRARESVDARVLKFYDQWWDEHDHADGKRAVFTRMAGKICITTTFDRNYRLAGQTLFKSIRRHTDCAGIDFKVIAEDPEVVQELGAEHCHFVSDEIKARYANVKYYHDLPKEKYQSSWFRYEMFSFEGYDRVLCIDSDCICIEDISYLFSEELNQYDLISTEDQIVSKMFRKHIPALESLGLNLRGLVRRVQNQQVDIQPALLVANRKIVNNQWYRRLLAYANESGFTYSIDEGILNDFIYMDGLRVRILPMEWNYMDTYGAQIPELPVPDRPVIVHCQESKPFRKDKATVNSRIHKWHDLWWGEFRFGEAKTIVAVIVWNRFENLKRWLNCWKRCDKTDAALVVVHNLESDNARYWNLCKEHDVRYVPRDNSGFDLGAFQDVCKERLANFPNNWDNLIWITDDCIPMQKDFVAKYLAKLREGYIPCYEISDEVKRHVRTTGFLVTKDLSRKLTFPRDPMKSREDCYVFEHKGFNLYEQITKLGLKPSMMAPALKDSPLWDSGCRASLGLWPKHEQVFPAAPPAAPVAPKSSGLLDDLAIRHKADKSSLYHNFAVKYDRLLSGFRETFTSVLEIGVAQGQSLRMWADYFPNAAIHGADISVASRTCESNRIKFHLTDQGNEAQLKNLEQFSPFDLIVDDGNHFWREQILSFKTLFPFLKKGGIYIVEDSCTSYWPEYKNQPMTCVDYFKGLVDEVNFRGARGRVPSNPPSDFSYWEKGWHRREDCQEQLPEFESIHFMNALIIIHKRNAL